MKSIRSPRTPMTRRLGSRTAWPPGLAIGIALMMLLGACGAASADDGSTTDSGGIATLADEPTTDDSTDGGDAGSTATGEVDTETQLLAFSACMRENGVDMEDPTVDADGNVQFGRPNAGGAAGGGAATSREDQEAAQTACEEFLEGVQLGRGGGAAFDNTELEDQLLEFTSCMRDNGYDIPDIEVGAQGGGARGGFGAGIDQNDPDYQAAFEICGDVLGGFGARVGGGQGGARAGADQ